MARRGGPAKPWGKGHTAEPAAARQARASAMTRRTAGSSPIRVKTGLLGWFRKTLEPQGQLTREVTGQTQLCGAAENTCLRVFGLEKAASNAALGQGHSRQTSSVPEGCSVLGAEGTEQNRSLLHVTHGQWAKHPPSTWSHEHLGAGVGGRGLPGGQMLALSFKG